MQIPCPDNHNPIYQLELNQKHFRENFDIRQKWYIVWYSDQAKNLNPDPEDPWVCIRIQAVSQH